MKKLLIIVISLAMFVMVNYIPWLLHHPEFIADDFYLISTAIEHPFPQFYDETITWQYFVQYRPLVMLTFHLNYLIGGVHPAWYLAVNMLLAIAGMLVFFLVLREFLQKKLPAASLWEIGLVSAVLLLHTDMFYSIVWISQRTESMMLLMYLLAIWSWLKYLHNHHTGYYAGFFVFYIFCLLSKSSGVHLPLITAVFFLWYRASSHDAWFHSKRRIFELAIPVLLMIAYVTVRSAFDPAASMLPMEYILRKPLSIVGIALIAFYTPLAEALYRGISYSHVWSGLFMLAVGGGLIAFYLRFRNARKFIILLASVFLLSLFPRIMAATSVRINSIQIVWVMFGMLVLLVATVKSPSRRILVLTSYLILHTISLHWIIPAWYKTAEAEQYTRIVQDYRSNRIVGSTLVFADLPSMDLYPWVMYFRRFGSFGYDSSAMRSNLGYAKQFGSRTEMVNLSREGDCWVADSQDRRTRVEIIQNLLQDDRVQVQFDVQGNMFNDSTYGSVCIRNKRDRWGYVVR